MITAFERLNPTEKRLVVIIGFVVFAVINLAWVRPIFSEWGDLGNRLDKANQAFTKQQLKLQEAKRDEPELKRLMGGGGDVPQEDQSSQLRQKVQMQAQLSGVTIVNTPSSVRRTNDEFFVEVLQPITTVSGERELVDFLYALGTDDSMIRVRDLSVTPDISHQRLNAQVRLLASYQKKPTPAKANPLAKPPAAAGPGAGKPAASKAATDAKSTVIVKTPAPGTGAQPDKRLKPLSVTNSPAKKK
jgi:hypothetical protein